MNVTNVLKVCDALESGEFEQGRHALNDKGKFCCLGVACEVFRREKDHGDSHWAPGVDSPLVFRAGAKDGDSCSAFLPGPVMVWLGFDNRSGLPISTYCSSSQANDCGVSFDVIAKEWRALAAAELARAT